jgi:hypothetical protein
LAEKKRAPIEQVFDDNRETFECLDVDDLDLITPYLKPRDDVGIADLHDEKS